MSHMIKSFLAGAVVLGSAFCLTPAAQAGHDSPVNRAACEYRDAVKKFERLVRDTRYVYREDVRLVDRLEDRTGDLHGASHNLRNLDRLFCRFDEASALHVQVERAIFGRSCYPRNPVLEACWQNVECAYRDLCKEITCLRQGAFGPVVAPRPTHSIGYGRHSTSIHDFREEGRYGVPPHSVRINRDSFYRSDYTPTLRRDSYGLPPELSSRPGYHARTPYPTHRNISSSDQLRNALIGALLQRMTH